MTAERLSIDTADGPMPAHLWRPPASTGPGILLLQEIFGVSAYLRDRAQDLAAVGYVVLAPELYWRIGVDEVDERGPDALDQAVALIQQLPWDDAVQDSVAALRRLEDDESVSGGSGVLGFCFGGGLAFHVAATSRPDALVSYYGSALPDLLVLAPEVTAPSLYHFGLADSYIEPAAVERIQAAVCTRPDVEVATYDGADHAFDNPNFPLHHPAASAMAWERTIAFLHRHLPPA